MAFCKHCGGFLDSDAVFCPKCGQTVNNRSNNSFSSSSVRCNECGTVYDASKRSCPNCYSKNREKVNAPSNNHYSFDKQTHSDSPTPTLDKVGGMNVNPVVIGVIIVIVVAAFFVIPMFNYKSHKTTNNTTTNNNTSSYKTTTTAPRAPTNEERVWADACQAVKTMLVAPSTASFQQQKIVKQSDGSYDVCGIVDSQNKMGAKLRKYFYVNIKLLPDEKFEYSTPQIADFDLSNIL